MCELAVRPRTASAQLLCALGLLGLRGSALAAEAPAAAEVALTSDLMVPMRDGVHLAADVYRPAHEGQPTGGRFPTLLMRTPYNKEVRASGFARYFAARGYVVVVQDVRGRYKSEGHWRALYDDGRDGSDTAAWIAHQGWSDGSIGTLGTSYEGAAQHALAIANAPNVKTMIPLFSMSDVGRYGVRHNGAFELRWLNWVFSMGDPGGGPNLIAAARAASDPAAAPAQMLEAGTPYEFTIEMYPTSLIVKRGHRIRLDISSSNFPGFDVNPNTGEPLNDNRGWRIAQNSVYLDSAHPSRILLPLVAAAGE
jgi:predicted acyl esterase